MSRDTVTEYARRIIKGDLPAGKFHRLACERHLRDLGRHGEPGFPFRYDIARAEQFFEFAGLLRHYKGEWAGQPIALQDWQKFALGSICAWVHRETGLRRYRTAYNEVPRKNGKTTMAAILALYLTFFDKEPGNEGYFVATKRDQSKICFNDAKRMVGSSGLKSWITAKVSNLHREETASKLEPLGADHDSTDGLNPGFVCVDEMHAMKDRGMLDVMETAMGARRQPLVFEITTAGDDPVSPCGDQHDYAAKILERVVDDETFFCFIAHADTTDDWKSKAAAVKANPNYGVSVKPDDMQSLVQKAINIPSAAAAYQQKRLGWWVNATAPCLSVDGWRQGQGTASRDAFLASLEHESCYVGIDLASKIDLCALSFVFPPTVGRPQWKLLQCIWTPADTLGDRAHRDRAPYQVWVDQGWLQTMLGTRVDHRVIREVLRAHRSQFDIERIGFDPWHADQLIEELIQEDGFSKEQVIEVPQTYQGMSSACLRMQAEILAGNVDARGCPVTAWAVSNTVGQKDGKDNLMFAKGRSRGRIDPVIAATIGVSLAIRWPAAAPAEVLAEWL